MRKTPEEKIKLLDKEIAENQKIYHMTEKRLALYNNRIYRLNLKKTKLVQSICPHNSFIDKSYTHPHNRDEVFDIKCGQCHKEFAESEYESHLRKIRSSAC